MLMMLNEQSFGILLLMNSDAGTLAVVGRAA